MADFNSSLPVRTENNGDIVAKLGDGTIASQFLGIDSSGRITIKLDDGSGNLITSQVSGAQRALDVGINVAGVQVDPRAIRALTSADIVSVVQSTSPWVVKDLADGPVIPGTVAAFSTLTGAQYNSTLPTLTTAQQSAIQIDSSGRLLISALPTGANTIGSVNQGTSPWVTSDLADGSVTGGIAGTKSLLAGGVYTAALPTLTTGQQVGVQTDVNGRLLVGSIFSPLPAGANLLGAVNLDLAGLPVSSTNPVPVTFSNTVIGTIVNKYNTSVAVAAQATVNHVYTISAAKVFSGRKFFIAGTGKIRADVQMSPDGTTYSTYWTAFNSSAFPNIDIQLDNLVIQDFGVGSTIRIIVKNMEVVSAQDVYSTISGVEN